MRGLRRYFEKLIEGCLLISGSLTSITILLIILFLFRESMGLFKSPVVEEGYVLALHPSNPVEKLAPGEIKDIFDAEITSWSQVGGKEENITVFRLGDITQYVPEEELGENMERLPAALSRVVDSIPGIIAFLPRQYIEADFPGKIMKTENIHPKDFFGGKEWFPTAQPAPQFGILPLILGTLWVSLAAILFSLPFGIAVAIYLAEIASLKMRNFLKPIIELLAGIPSVVFGFSDWWFWVPFIQKIFHLPVGESGLAGAIILAIMALPTIITVAEDAMRSTPRAMKEASLALGATHWQTVYRVIIPYSLSGIMAAAVLGIGRAIGETMAVLMVTGNAAVMPHSLLNPVRTIPATIAAELGEAPNGGTHYQALFSLGAILFLITLLMSIAVEFILAKQHKNRAA